MANTTPQELMDAFDTVTNSNSRVNVGRTDAIYHVGKMLAGEMSADYLHDLQDEIANTADPEYDAKYHYGYLTAWNAISGLVKGYSLKDIAKYHG